MSHFAEINSNNVVLRVLVGDSNLPNEGQDWFVENLGGTWIQTSINGNIRKNYAGVGFTYDETLDAFIAPKPFDSWTLDQISCTWQPPVPMPTSGSYRWDEASVNWIEIQGE